MLNVSKCFTNHLLNHVYIILGFSPILLGPKREDKYPIQLSETLFREMKKYTEYQSKTVSHVKYLAKSRIITVFFEITPWNSKVKKEITKTKFPKLYKKVKHNKIKYYEV